MEFLKRKFEQQISATVDEESGDVRIQPISSDSTFQVILSSPRILRDMEADSYETSFNEWRSLYIQEQLERAEKILAIHEDGKNRFNRLKAAIGSASGVVPFVGAGMSCESGFKGWQGYLWSLQAESGVSAETLGEMLSNGKFEDAADMLLADLGENLFEEKLQTAYTAFDGSPIHGAINYLPQLFRKAVITTNFDSLVEKIYASNGETAEFQEILKGTLGTSFNRHVSEGRRCLLKLHGHFTEPVTRVLTKSEYDVAYADGNGFVGTLKSAYKGNTFLFIGCSLDADRTMQVFKGFVDEDRENVPSHFAFLPEPQDGEIRRAKERMLAERKIVPIWYPDGEHDISIEALFLRALSELNLL